MSTKRPPRVRLSDPTTVNMTSCERLVESNANFRVSASPPRSCSGSRRRSFCGTTWDYMSLAAAPTRLTRFTESCVMREFRTDGGMTPPASTYRFVLKARPLKQNKYFISSGSSSALIIAPLAIKSCIENACRDLRNNCFLLRSLEPA